MEQPGYRRSGLSCIGRTGEGGREASLKLAGWALSLSKTLTSIPLCNQPNTSKEMSHNR